MSAYINQVYLLGNLGQDPVIQSTSIGNMVTFVIATSTFYRDRNTNDWITNTEWHRIVVFNEKLIDTAKHLKKGSKVFVRGMIKSRKYTDKTGIERTSVDIQADEIQIITKIETNQSYPSNSFPENSFNNGSSTGTGNNINSSGFGGNFNNRLSSNGFNQGATGLGNNQFNSAMNSGTHNQSSFNAQNEFRGDFNKPRATPKRVNTSSNDEEYSEYCDLPF